MRDQSIPQHLRTEILALQRGELTEHHIYRMLAHSVPEGSNRQVLLRLAEEEHRHYRLWRDLTGEPVQPDALRIWLYCGIARILGITFGIQLMEGGENRAIGEYRRLSAEIPLAGRIAADEIEHENQLAGMIDEKALRYVGSVVLGLNDALVEFTGTLAGLTFALQNARLIAGAGIITGIAASLSMGASEYLSRKSDGRESPLTAAVYTGGAYVATVGVLVAPYLLLENPFAALPLTLTGAILVILAFTFYISVAKGLPFWRRFSEMAAISLGIAAASFAIGLGVRSALGVDI